MERKRSQQLRSPRPANEYVFGAGVLIVVLWFAAGIWQRRWIADDGLIVLRTVRNLVAGNGPVFNVGERVESNTSTLWTYLIWVTHEVLGYRLELVSLGLAMGLSLVAVIAAMAGARVLWRAHGHRYASHPAGAKPTLLVPFGILIYIVLPPARDFATSGLETGLVLAWIGLLWWGMQLWALARPCELRWHLPTPLVGSLAFVAGLGPLVRPEMTLVAVVVLALLAAARQSWVHLGWLVVIAGTIPISYQLWRMSFYGLPYPITAVAKDAGGAKWGKGLDYLWNFLDPYLLLLPLVAAAVATVTLWWARRLDLVRQSPASPHGSATAADLPESPADECVRGGIIAPLRTAVRTTHMVTAAFVVLALVMLMYEIRVGGDFMHGRVLLPTLFLLLLPVAVIPLTWRAAAAEHSAKVRRLMSAVAIASWVTVTGWALYVQISEEPFRIQPEVISHSGVVDERQFYIQRTGHRHPILADDYLDYPRMRPLVESVMRNETGAVFISEPGFEDRWDVIPYDHPRPGMQPFELPDDPIKTVVFLNLGMTSMNLPLDVTVYDTVGLAAPLAAHTVRLEDGRIGHDKFLPYDWILAETQVIEEPENYPSWVDVNWINQAEVALTCPATQAVLESYRAPLTRELRWSNIAHAIDYAGYRINRIPAYEVQRCGLPMPEEVEKHPGTK